MQKEAELQGLATIPSIKNLKNPTTTSVSIITPPKVMSQELIKMEWCLKLMPRSINGTQVTLGILEEAKALNIPALWLQPGAEDAAVIKYIEENGLSDRVVLGGPCVLVSGDGIVRSLL